MVGMTGTAQALQDFQLAGIGAEQLPSMVGLFAIALGLPAVLTLANRSRVRRYQAGR